MARPSKIDWIPIERDYRTGQFSNRMLAEKHGVDKSGLNRKIKQDGWVQDLSVEVRERTRAALLKTEREEKTSAATPRDIEIAVQTNVAVVTRHRKQVGKGQDIVALLMTELIESSRYNNEIQDAIIDETAHDKTDMRRGRMLRAVSLSSRSATVRDLANALKCLITAERQAYNLDEQGSEESIDDRLLRLAK